MYLSLDEYYKKLEELTPPEGLSLIREIHFRRVEIGKLREQLSPEDLKIVLEREDRWQQKVNSSFNPSDLL